MLSITEINKLAKALSKEVAEVVKEATIQANDELLTVKDAAAFLKLKPTAIYKAIKESRIPFHKKHNTYYFSKQELLGYYLDK
jgi:excisionase family DNA binding protein